MPSASGVTISPPSTSRRRRDCVVEDGQRDRRWVLGVVKYLLVRGDEGVLGGLRFAGSRVAGKSGVSSAGDLKANSVAGQESVRGGGELQLEAQRAVCVLLNAAGPYP